MRTQNPLGPAAVPLSPDVMSLVRLEPVAEVELFLRKTLAAFPEDIESICNLGVITASENRWHEACDLFRRALKLNPQHRRALSELGRSLVELRDFSGAVDALMAARRLAPTSASVLYRLALAHALAGDYAESVDFIDECSTAEPSFAPVHRLEGWIYFVTGHPHRAINPLRRFLELRPGDRDGTMLLACVKWQCGDLDEALQLACHVIDSGPVPPSFHANYLSWRLHHIQETRVSSREAAAQWGRRASPFRDLSVQVRRPVRTEGLLRVGYVSQEFSAGPAFHFIAPLIEQRAKSKVEAICYFTGIRTDPWAERMRTFAGEWRHCLTDAELVDAVAADGPDILVDPSGHYGHHTRLFQSRHAPVQIAFPSYPGSTGAVCMDYILTDSWVCPPGADGQYTERAVRLRSGYLPWRPPLSPPLKDPPCVKSRRLTFGMLQRPPKMNPAVWDAIACVLLSVRNSRLLVHFQAAELDDPTSAVHLRLHRELALRGVDPARLLVRGPTSLEEHIDLLSDIDISLDTFPYNGQTTTCECLWMGVPVVTLAGDTHVSRVGYQIMDRVGIGSTTVAWSKDEYVAKAIQLAQNDSLRCQLRHSLRAMMIESPLVNGAVLRDIEEVYATLTLCSTR